jgi:uncharacterized protein YyaL (SSP411 family)
MRLLLLLLLILLSCTEKRENLLKHEKSPYLNQHKDNPVWWMPWSESAFELAQKENKLVFLSIGYSSCHWCHVMEEESYSDPAVARVLNDHFISIKVDREERPDIDKIYMEAMMAIRRTAGWPLNMFLTADKKPFWGGTYLPKDKFLKVLPRLSKLYQEDPKKIKTNAQKIHDYIQYRVDRAYKLEISDTYFTQMFDKLWEDFDNVYGGFGQAPKFPPKARIDFLMNLSQTKFAKDKRRKIAKMINYTLQGMFRGGIYDHIGGGFARYSTDKFWLVPHFEKMLYDNASLAQIYFKAHKWSGLKLYKQVGEDILRFIHREMQDPQGAFYSSIDADSEGEEGKYYVWGVEELSRYLGLSDSFNARDIYDVRVKGSFHGKNIFNLIGTKKEGKVFTEEIITFKDKLLKIREKRVAPFKDKKILTSWNGLMISAMAYAYKVTQNKKYLDSAFKAADFILKNLYLENKLYHRFMDGEVKVAGNRNDFAYLIEGLIELYQVSYKENYLLKAIELTNLMDNTLWDEKYKGYLFAPKSSDQIKQFVDFSDNVRKNSNATAIINMIKLYHLTYKDNYIKRAKQMLEYHQNDLKGFVGGYAQMLNAGLYYSSKNKQIAIVGIGKKAFEDLYHSEFLPFSVIASTENHKDFSFIGLLKNKTSQKGQARAYVCIDKVCKLPADKVNEFRKQLIK